MRFWVIALMVIGLVLVFVFVPAAWYLFNIPSRELKREMDWLKANKLPTKIDELQTLIPASQNAAPIYQKAFAAMKLSREEGSWLGEQISRKRVLSGQVNWAKLKQLVEQNREAIKIVHQAASLPSLRLTDWHKENPLDIEFPHFMKMRNLTRLLVADALIKKQQEGDIEDAVRNCVTTFKMAKHISDDAPIVLGLVVSAEIFSKGHDALEVTLTDAEARPQSYRSLIESLSSLNFAQDAVRAWRGERAFGLAIYDWLEKTTPEELLERLGEEFPDLKLRQPSGLFTKFAWRFTKNSDKALFLWGMRNGEKHLRAWLLQGSTPLHPEAEKISRQFEEELLKRGRKRLAIVAAISIPSFGAFIPKVANNEAKRRVALTAVALRLYRREHGRYPESLSELVPKFLPSVPLDPFTNKPLQYRRTEKGFVVWSIGWDGKDDGGKLRLDEHKWEKGDIVWESHR